MQLSVPPPVRTIVARLREHGYETYLCGGCVRDGLMSRMPEDWDIATAATPDAVEELFEHTVPVGRAFGVMLVVIEGISYEVATFRADQKYVDGRRPSGVVFSSAEEDVKRRDFTINALLYDPDREQLIDLVGGEKDINNRLLRTVGDPEERFEEDRLRMLRAVRFSARTGFSLEPATRDAICHLAPLISSVSAERIGEELAKMVSGPGNVLRLLDCTNLLEVLLPELKALQGVEQPPQFHPEGDVWEHTIIMADMLAAANAGDWQAAIDKSAGETPSSIDRSCGMEPSDMSNDERVNAVTCIWRELSPTSREILSFAVLLHDIGKPCTFTVSDRIRFNNHDRIGAEMAKEIMNRLKRPRVVAEGVKELIGRHIHLANLRKMRKSKLRRWLQEESFPLHLELHRMDCESSHRMMANYSFGFDAWREEMALPPEPEPLITGKDLIRMGYAPGPAMGEILHSVTDAVLEKDVTTIAEAEAYVRRHFPQ